MIGTNTNVRLLLVVPLLAAGIASGTPSPAAAALVCNDPSQQFDVIYKGNVVIPANGNCSLFGAVIQGGVTAEPGAIVSFQDVEVRGSVTATNPFTFELIEATVRGNVTATGSANSAVLSRVEVRSNVTLTDTMGDWVYLLDAAVRGSATVSRNNVDSVEIFGNTIRGDLACADNTPDPVGSGNSVSGAKTGECQFL